MKLRAALATFAAAILLAAMPTTAHADELDPQIAAALQAVPGGEALNSTTAYWPDLAMTLKVPDPRLRESIGNCPNGSVCAFTGDSLTGSRLAWTTCGTFSTTAFTVPVRSIAMAARGGDPSTAISFPYAELS
ncbi:hypothetical protein AB1K54_16555 [Microbacterium sp. BWT-B31]|uniref:hypothetical protein n=1 Tax=Microbacterium sp. BWT-B31 TaxID=3232072 RepID=UPI003527D6E3